MRLYGRTMATRKRKVRKHLRPILAVSFVGVTGGCSPNEDLCAVSGQDKVPDGYVRITTVPADIPVTVTGDCTEAKCKESTDAGCGEWACMLTNGAESKCVAHFGGSTPKDRPINVTVACHKLYGYARNNL
jgi:hypothetical protein